MANANRQYVFVCCGAAEHTHTLHIALDALRNRTKLTIQVVTDSTRNEVPIRHEHIVDVRTPEHLNHHQASIWLKTSLHRLLPSGNRYVYLDTDILAIGENPDGVFDEYLPPIRFAADHCRLMQFSPYAVNCSCFTENEAIRTRVNCLSEEADPYFHSNDEAVKSGRKQLQQLFHGINSNRWLKLKTAVGFVLARGRFTLPHGFYFDKRTKTWFTAADVPIMRRVDMRSIARREGLHWNGFRNELQKVDGTSIWKDDCAHLPQFIEKKWGIRIADPNWQHWNGGVFLFSDESHAFMDTWHHHTLSIFSDPEWKTRDQGTLVATAWQLGVQNQPLLDKKWNYIADYHNTTLQLSPDGSAISLDGKTFDHPELIHVYHHFGDTGWEVWNWVERRIPTHTH